MSQVRTRLSPLEGDGFESLVPVHKEQSHPGEHPPIIDHPLGDAVQAQLAGKVAQRNEGGK